ncbi:unnamed protein product [Strongylus vulgaris]|uniref:Uncharacterized protein n=1 Tax=Strongylus vulgaris TaxID=40348 RepID=A0A3P7JJT3_STRVU|nr:unnamed protein product [Strongylus vulgaris]
MNQKRKHEMMRVTASVASPRFDWVLLEVAKVELELDDVVLQKQFVVVVVAAAAVVVVTAVVVAAAVAGAAEER